MDMITKNVKRVRLNTNSASDKRYRWFNRIQMFILRYFNTKHDINKFILLLQKGVYVYKFMDDCKRKKCPQRF